MSPLTGLANASRCVVVKLASLNGVSVIKTLLTALSSILAPAVTVVDPEPVVVILVAVKFTTLRVFVDALYVKSLSAPKDQLLLYCTCVSAPAGFVLPPPPEFATHA